MRGVVVACVLLAAGCVSSRAAPPPQSAYLVFAGQAALSAGDIELAEKIMARARAEYPRDGAVWLWGARLASMRWRHGDAVLDLARALQTPRCGGWTEEELRGEIGDVLFQLGRYGESVPFLRAGAVGQQAATRLALMALAAEMPYVRAMPELTFAELPLVEGPPPELICRVGDKQRSFGLDTGASFSTLSTSLAAELGVAPVLPAGDGRDGTGEKFPIGMGILNNFVLGEVPLGPQPVMVVEDARLGLRQANLGPLRRVDAVVGLDVLSRFRVTFDPQRGSVVFQPRRGMPEASSVPCLWTAGRLVLPVEIEGREFWFVLDTGASDSSFTPAGLALLRGGAQRAHETLRGVHSPAGHGIAVRVVRDLTLRVSGAEFRGVDLPVVARTEPELFPLHGVLGANLLLRCRTTLDSGRIRVEPLDSGAAYQPRRTR